MSDKIRKYVLPNLPYLFVFWFFSKIGTVYRIAPGADFGTKLMGMLDTFPKAFETYWPGLGGIDLLVGLAGAAGVYLLIQSKIKQAKKFRRDAEYGTARWGTKEDMESTKRRAGICKRSSPSRQILTLCWATPSRAKSRKRSVEGMKIRSKATQILRAMLARRYGFGASPNKLRPGLCGHGGIACHLAATLKMA